MKKQIFALGAILFSGILFAGCSSSKADSDTETILQLISCTSSTLLSLLLLKLNPMPKAMGLQ